MEKQIVIVGGGFAGIACALRLDSYQLPNVKIRLISDNPNFEYHAAMYRVVTGKSPMEVCLPLQEIFRGTSVEVVKDKVISIDIERQLLCGESSCDYGYDELVLALGSETVYYNTPGLETLAFGFKSVHEAIELKRHLQELFQTCSLQDKDNQVCATHLLVVGGGPSGTELTGELAIYARKLAKAHGLHPSLVTIDLIQSPERLVPQASERMSERIEQRLRMLGVNVYLNRRVVKEEIEEVFLKDMEVKAKTLVWAAGVKAHRLHGQIKGLTLDHQGRVEVNKYLQAKGFRHVWVAGDGASVADAGLGQSALAMGRHVATVIGHQMLGLVSSGYEPGHWVLAVPVGPGWAAVEWRGWRFYGMVGWWIRRGLDLWVFLQFLSVGEAWKAWRAGAVEWESGTELPVPKKK